MLHPLTENKVREIREAIASAVRMARADKRLTQAETAALAGVNVNRIKDIENAARDPKFSTIVRVAEALGVQVAVSMGRAA